MRTRRSHQRRRRSQRGGGCGCGGTKPLLQNGGDVVPASPPAASSNLPFSQIKGGRRQNRRLSRRHRSAQRGGGWDAIFTGNYTLNPIANIGTTAGAYSNAGTLYGASEVDPSPNRQAVSFYNSANMRVA